MTESLSKKQSAKASGHSVFSSHPEMQRDRILVLTGIFIILIFTMILEYREIPGDKEKGADSDGRYPGAGSFYSNIEITNKHQRISIIRFDDGIEKYVTSSEIPPVSHNTNFIYMDFPFLREMFYCMNECDTYITDTRIIFEKIHDHLQNDIKIILEREQQDFNPDDANDSYKLIFTMMQILEKKEGYSLTSEQLELLEEYKRLSSEIEENSSRLKMSLMRDYTDDQLKYIFVQLRTKDPDGKGIESLSLTTLAACAYDIMCDNEKDDEKNTDTFKMADRKNGVFSKSQDDKLYINERAYGRQIWTLRTLLWGVRELQTSENYRLSDDQKTEIRHLLVELSEIEKQAGKLNALKNKIFTRQQLTYLKVKLKELKIDEADK